MDMVVGGSSSVFTALHEDYLQHQGESNLLEDLEMAKRISSASLKQVEVQCPLGIGMETRYGVSLVIVGRVALNMQSYEGNRAIHCEISDSTTSMDLLKKGTSSILSSQGDSRLVSKR
ncbi:hypothetical protein GOBAR_DD27869 [Gossypium barbadense]|nr:hypothetical protein GOBAR_DD27869 [Gossypium barbadense]